MDREEAREGLACETGRGGQEEGEDVIEEFGGEAEERGGRRVARSRGGHSVSVRSPAKVLSPSYSHLVERETLTSTVREGQGAPSIAMHRPIR